MSIEQKLEEVKHDQLRLNALKQELNQCENVIALLSGNRTDDMEGGTWATVGIGIGCKDNEPYHYQFSTGMLDEADIESLLAVAQNTLVRLKSAIDTIEKQYE